MHDRPVSISAGDASSGFLASTRLLRCISSIIPSIWERFGPSAIFFCGAASIIINYLADRQRQEVRAKNGNCLVWKRPPHLIQANYQTQTEKNKKANPAFGLGLVGHSRHFHYIPEIMGAFFWSLPALFRQLSPLFLRLFPDDPSNR